MYLATKNIKPIKYRSQNTSTHPSIYKPLIVKAKVKSADMIEAMIKSSFLFSRKFITLPFIKLFIPMVAPTIQTIIITSEIAGTKISVVSVILFID
mgnify:CR=1 FL=1